MPLFDPFDDDYKPSPLEQWLGDKARRAFYKTLAAANVYPVSTLMAPLREAIDADDPQAIDDVVKKNPKALRGELDVLAHSALVYALANEKYAAAEAMLTAEPGLVADRDYFGATPHFQLLSPVHGDDDKVIRAIDFLLKHGASLDETDKEASGVVAAAAGRSGGRVAAFLLDRGAPINTKDNQGCTPLMQIAGLYERDGMVKFLVERGTDLQAQSSDGYTAATLCLRAGNESLTRYLIAQGGKINFAAKGMENYLAEPDPAWSKEFVELLKKQKTAWDEEQSVAAGAEAAEEMTDGLKTPIAVHHQLHFKQPERKKGFLFGR